MKPTRGQRLYDISVRHNPETDWAKWQHISNEARARYERIALEFEAGGPVEYICIHCGSHYADDGSRTLTRNHACDCPDLPAELRAKRERRQEEWIHDLTRRVEHLEGARR